MARPATGRVEVQGQVDGTLRFRLRFRALGKRQSQYLHEARDCACGCGGGWSERTAHVELKNILARVQAGVWERPKVESIIEKTFTEMPTFQEWASYWLQAKLEGVIGEKPISENTHTDYKTMLQRHLLPFFGRFYLNEIDQELCKAFKTHKIKEAHELQEALDAGADLRDNNKRKLRPLGPATIRKLLNCLGAILEEAVEDEWIPVNHARSKRLKVHVPKPKRSFLEMDELACIEDAGAEQDPNLQRFAQAANEARPGSIAAAVALALSEGKRQKEIAAELKVAKGTVHFHVRNLGAQRVGRYAGRKALLCTLGRSGVRNGELSAILIGHLRLHDPKGVRFHIPDAKTESGIRVVEVSPYHAEVLIGHLDRLERAGNDTGPAAHLFQNERGGRLTRKRVGEIVHEAATLASERMQERGLPPLPRITPHSLRRTYISIALLANKYDIEWVMKQVGHADSKMTLDVYNQLQQRAKREHGAAFDRLMRQAREQLHGDKPPRHGDSGHQQGGLGPRLGPRRENSPQPAETRRPARGHKLRVSRENAGLRRRDSASGHKCFQSYALPTELSRRGHDLSVF